MRMLKGARLGTVVSGAAFSVALGLSAATGVLVLATTAAQAQTVLDGGQLSAIRASLSTSVQKAGGGAAANRALIAKAVENAVALYGSDAAGAIASAIMANAGALGVSDDVVGAGMAQAAADLSSVAGTKVSQCAAQPPTISSAATAIATAVANEGKPIEVSSFQTVVSSLCFTNLASIAGAGANPTGEVAAVPGGVGGLASVVPNNGFTGSSGCLNPSCTSF
ncbi:MAG: hypothetical protein P4L57_09775 [Rhizomicrobium sp.]|nr:hypothetical protein [Rhizomicrobium sp.]